MQLISGFVDTYLKLNQIEKIANNQEFFFRMVCEYGKILIFYCFLLTGRSFSIKNQRFQKETQKLVKFA